VHKNTLDHASQGFYISLVLRCSKSSAGTDTEFNGGAPNATAAEWLIRSQRKR
jgi:hypothetical protein